MTKRTSNQDKKIRDAALRELREASVLLGSDPDLIESMSFDEVRVELRGMGLDPDLPLSKEFWNSGRSTSTDGLKEFDETPEERPHTTQRYPVKNVAPKIRRRSVDPIHPATRFLWWCCGAATDILRASPTEKNKYVGIGGAVLSTWLLASASGVFTIYTILEESSPRNKAVALVLGLVWGLIIFNLDRYIISTMKKTGDSNRFRALIKELGTAAPRLLIVALLGIVISHPLALALFDSEISSQIELNKDQLVREREAELAALNVSRVAPKEAALTNILAELASKRELVDDLRDKFLQEVEGTGGAKKYGYGLLAKAVETQYQNAVYDYQEVKAASLPERQKLEDELARIEEEKHRELKEYRSSLGQGFLARSKALSDLTNKESAIWYTHITIVLIIILIEISPILLKLLSYGPYDAKLILRNEREIRAAELEKDFELVVVKHHYDCITFAESEIERAFVDNIVKIQTRKILQARTVGDRASNRRSLAEYSQSLK